MIENGGFGSRFSLTDEGYQNGNIRGIFAHAKTGYVVLRIEPSGQGRPSRPCRASSAFPALTGALPLAAGLGAGTPAHSGRSAASAPGLVDSSRTDPVSVTLGGRSLTHEGQTPAELPCKVLTFEGFPGFSALASTKTGHRGRHRGHLSTIAVDNLVDNPVQVLTLEGRQY